MPDDCLSRFRVGRFEAQSHAHMLGPGAPQAELIREIATQRTCDEQERLTVFDRRFELPMHAGELRRPPGHELVWLQTSREMDRMPALTAELALQLPRPDRCDGAQRSQAQKVKPLQLLGVEWKLMRGKRSEVRIEK